MIEWVKYRKQGKLIEAAEAYEHEKARWGVRVNKAYSPVRCEIFRSGDDGDPVVQASTTGMETAEYERNEMSFIAAMKAAAAILETSTKLPVPNGSACRSEENDLSTRHPPPP